MLRTITATALFALSLTAAAQADPAAPDLNTRIQQAAENVCAPLLGSHGSLLYKKWFTDCVTDSNAKITAFVAADKHRTLASN